MEEHFRTLFKIPIGKYSIPVSSAIVEMWAVMAIITIFAIIVNAKIKSGKFKKIPDTKFQNLVEALVKWIYDLTEDSMGSKYKDFAPLIGTIGITLLLCNLFSFTGLPQPTANPAVPIGFALVVFFNIHYQAMKFNGFRGWFRMFSTPFKFMIPLNLMVELSVPVSLSMRLFGNMLAGLTIIELVYNGLRKIFYGAFGLLIPIPLHFFFDLFDGGIQTFVFMMLTMVFIKNGLQHGEEHH